MLKRAETISRIPADETIILVAHGTGDEEANARWLQLLDSLATQINSLSADQFRAVRYATWREDWPAKRGPWIEKVRGYVQEAQADGGTALVIPARTNATGPAERLLEGLDFRLGEGFAPHPLFAEWVQAQVILGSESLLGQAN